MILDHCSVPSEPSSGELAVDQIPLAFQVSLTNQMMHLYLGCQLLTERSRERRCGK